MSEDKTTIVKTGGGGSTVIAFILGIIVVLVALYVVFGTDLLRNAPQKVDANVKIETPGNS
ncbi:hypothetical protein [Sphingomonas lycopersici]|uniref:Uncharacterized protein n=1 Tax=Sphingomonas lycopersici TaxID=2951807 RepID=A0AA41Z688_9SPHN|nr:hypothetical protein [Sphingomonas lycopersici]MCW6533622.1 hypothetical protein [Sphingomonas lycopersici]